MRTLIISVYTFLWFQWFWSQTQHVPLCWGHNAVLRHLCKQTVYFIYLFPAEYEIIQLVQNLSSCGSPEGLGFDGHLAGGGLLAAAEDTLQDGQVLLLLIFQSLVILRQILVFL